MAERPSQHTIRRKIAAARSGAAIDALDDGARAWRLALARAASTEIDLALDVIRLTDRRHVLAELLDLLPERAFIAMLQGPKGGLGVLVLSPGLLSALIEKQTIGTLSPAAPPPRRPTVIDAAMTVTLIDRALADLELSLAQSPDLSWAGGFRYGSFLEDPRPLGLVLDDIAYRVLTAELSLGTGARTGQALLVLPANGRGMRPVAPPPAPGSEADAARKWSVSLAEVVMETEAPIQAVIARVSIPLAQLVALAPDSMVPLGAATIEAVALETPDGLQVATGRLGQQKGARALRLTQMREKPGSGRVAAEPVVPTSPSAAAGPANPAFIRTA